MQSQPIPSFRSLSYRLRYAILILLALTSQGYAQKEPIRIVAFGNSITSERKNIEKVFAQRLPALLKNVGIEAEIVNSGVGGSHTGRAIDNKPTEKIKHAQERFQAQVLDKNPDLVIIGFGANDAYIDTKKEGDPSRISLQKFRNNLSYMIETLQAKGIRVVLMGTNGYRQRDQDFLHERLLAYVAEAESLSKKYKTGFVNNQKLFETYQNQPGHSSDDLFQDHLHPNDRGHELIADALSKEIRHVIAHQKVKKTNRLVTKDEYGAPVTISKPSGWEAYRKQIHQKMESVMGPLPRTKLPAPTYVVTDSLHTDRYKRLTIQIRVKPEETVAAYLYIPHQRAAGSKLPAMLALHETDMPGKKSVDGEGSYEKSRQSLGYGKELAERGYVVIAPDYPSFGESVPYDFKTDAYESGTMKGIFNHRRCIDLLERLDFVDKNRIGTIGHSLGGHNSIFLAAFDTRIKVTVSSCGWTQLDYYDIGPVAAKQYGGRLGPFAQERYMPMWTKYGLDGTQKPFEFHQLLSAIAPRAFFSSSPVGDKNFDVNGVKEGISLAEKGYKFLNAGKNIQVRYPEAGHEFPKELREEAYQYIDTILSHTQTK
jgi:lysophospholipase L1-like esterase